MMPNAAMVRFSRMTAALVSGLRMARRTRASFQLHPRPRSISSRDIAAMAAASPGVASSTLLEPDFDLVAIRVRHVGKWKSGCKLTAAQQLPAGVQHLINGAIDVRRLLESNPK